MKEYPIFEIPPYMIVVEEKTGIKYTAQVGGLSCLHKEVEGFLLHLPVYDCDPCVMEVVRETLSMEWEYEGKRFTCCEGCHGETVSENYLKVIQSSIDDLIQRGYLAKDYKIIIDKSRIAESTEAWIPILLDFKTLKSIGWLHLENCD